MSRHQPPEPLSEEREPDGTASDSPSQLSAIVDQTSADSAVTEHFQDPTQLEVFDELSPPLRTSTKTAQELVAKTTNPYKSPDHSFEPTVISSREFRYRFTFCCAAIATAGAAASIAMAIKTWQAASASVAKPGSDLFDTPWGWIAGTSIALSVTGSALRLAMEAFFTTDPKEKENESQHS